MKIYSFSVADMEVALLCNGLDNLIKNLPYEVAESNTFDEADVVILFSGKEDKGIRGVIEKIETEGVNAGLVISITAGDKTEKSRAVDMNILAKEPHLKSALSSVLVMLDYYTHINSVDIGYELASSGSFYYIPPTEGEVFGLIPQKVSETLGETKLAFMLLEAGEDIWISEIDTLCDELSSICPETEIKVFAARTLGENNVKCSLFKKID